MNPWRMLISGRREASCREARHKVQSYLDGELDPHDTKRIQAHLEHCRRCGMNEAIYREIKWSLLRSASPTEAATVQRLDDYARHLVTSGGQPPEPPSQTDT